MNLCCSTKNAALLILFIQCLVKYSQAEGKILQSPTTQIILPGENATFRCNVSRWGYWIVNGNRDTTLWVSRGIASSVNEMTAQEPADTTTSLTLTISGQHLNNGSRIQCYAYDDTPFPVISNISYLIIAGIPLSPYVDLTLTNHTTLRIEWHKPFTWTKVADITSYTVSVYNSSGLEWKNRTVDPSVNYIIVAKSDHLEQCAELFFYVSATNVIGTSSNGDVSGGFPVAIEWSSGKNSTARITPLVQYNKDGTIVVTIRVQSLTMCSYQFARYDVTICNSNDGTQLHKTSAFRKYGNGEPVDIPVALRHSVKEQKLLCAIVIVSSLNFTSLQEIVFFDVFPNNLNSADEQSSQSDGVVLAGAITGPAVGLLLVTVLVISFAVGFKILKAKHLREQSIREGLESITISEPVTPPQRLNFEQVVYADVSTSHGGNEKGTTIAETNLSVAYNPIITSSLPIAEEDYVEMKSSLAENISSIHEMRFCDSKEIQS